MPSPNVLRLLKLVLVAEIATCRFQHCNLSLYLFVGAVVDKGLTTPITGELLAEMPTHEATPAAIKLSFAWVAASHVAVIVASGHRLPLPDELPEESEFLAKPFSPERLLSLIAHAGRDA